MEMEASPKTFVKKPGRLSLARRPKFADSPITPGRTIRSPSALNTPPSSRVKESSPYSTPLHHYKRTCFIEESPSQDYDSDPSALPLCSQDVRPNIIDVGWKWEEQSPNNVPKKPNAKAQRIETNYYRPKRQSKKAIFRKLPECDKTKGFYKFKEELLQELSKGAERAGERDESPPTDMDFDELDSSYKENDGVQISSRLQMFQNIEMKVAKRLAVERKEKQKNIPNLDSINSSEVKTKPTPNPIITPSAKKSCDEEMKRSTLIDNPIRSQQEHIRNADIIQFPEIKMEHSHNPFIRKPCVQNAQQHELTQTKLVDIPPAQPSTSSASNERHLLEDSDLDNLLLQCSQQVESCYHDQIKRKKVEQPDYFDNDSLDDLFLSVDVGDKELEHSQSKLCRSPLIRHNSMPTKSPFSRKIPQNPANNFIRHNSMPSNEQQKKDEKTILLGGLHGGSTSAESIAAEKRRCTAAEIERKRLEAIKRREASKLRKLARYSTRSNI